MFRQLTFFSLVLTLFFAVPPCWGKPFRLPEDIITLGLRAYKFKDAKAGVEGWYTGSLLEGTEEEDRQITLFQSFEKSYGKFIDHERLRTFSFSKQTRLVFLALNYERGVVFARFATFDNSERSTLTSLTLSQKPEEIFPDFYFFPDVETQTP